MSKITPVISEDIIKVYTEVLACDKFGFDKVKVEVLLSVFKEP